MPMNDDGLRFFDHRWVAHTVVARDGRYLLLKRGAGRYLGGQWDFPGGSVEPGETAREAALRETTEEAALDVRITDEITHFTNAGTWRSADLFPHGDLSGDRACAAGAGGAQPCGAR